MHWRNIMWCFVNTYNKSKKKPCKTNKTPPKWNKTPLQSNPRHFQVSIKTLLFKSIQFIREMRQAVLKIFFLKWKEIPWSKWRPKAEGSSAPGGSTCKTALPHLELERWQRPSWRISHFIIKEKQKRTWADEVLHSKCVSPIFTDSWKTWNHSSNKYNS